MRNRTVSPCSVGYPGECWLRGMSLQQVLQRFTTCPCFESSRFGFWALPHVLAHRLQVWVLLPAHQSPSVAATKLSFKNTVRSSLVKVIWGSACSDYPCNPCNLRLASRPQEKFEWGILFILISLLIDSSLSKYRPAGNFLNPIFSSSILPR